MTNGLLSQAERDFLRGESEVDNPQGYRGNLRHRARKRIEQIEEDLELLEECGHEDIANEFRDRYSQREQLRDELENLHDRLEDLSQNDDRG